MWLCLCATGQRMLVASQRRSTSIIIMSGVSDGLLAQTRRCKLSLRPCLVSPALWQGMCMGAHGAGRGGGAAFGLFVWFVLGLHSPGWFSAPAFRRCRCRLLTHILTLHSLPPYKYYLQGVSLFFSNTTTTRTRHTTPPAPFCGPWANPPPRPPQQQQASFLVVIATPLEQQQQEVEQARHPSSSSSP